MLLTQIMEFCDPAQIEWVFLGIFDNDITADVMLESVHRFCPTVQQHEIMAACETCDVVITWGTPLEGLIPEPPRRAKFVLMALGMDEFTRHVMTSSHAADSLIAVSHVAEDTIPDDQRDKVTFIPTAVDLQRIVPRTPVQEMREQWYLREGQKALVYLGRVAPEKNPIAVARLIAAMHRLGHTEWRGIVVGPPGPPKYNTFGYIPDVEGLSQEIAPGLVKFVGPAPEVGSVYAAADHMILPSFIEGNSIALLEIWASGKPVLATPVGLVAHEHPDLVRVVDAYAMGWELALGLVADIEDPEGTAARVARAKDVAIGTYSTAELGRRWTDHIIELARR